MSLGIPVGFGLEDAVAESIKQGFHYAVATGNSSDDRCEIYTPVGVKGAVTTSASDINDAEASFSSFGPCVDVYAPGVNILSLGISSDTATALSSGTSMASPHAAGVIALLLEKYPDKKPTKIAKKIRKQATQTRSPASTRRPRTSCSTRWSTDRRTPRPKDNDGRTKIDPGQARRGWRGAGARRCPARRRRLGVHGRTPAGTAAQRRPCRGGPGGVHRRARRQRVAGRGHRGHRLGAE